MINLNNLIFEINFFRDHWCVEISLIVPPGDCKKKFVTCSSLAAVADLLVSVEKVLRLFDFDDDDCEVMIDES